MKDLPVGRVLLIVSVLDLHILGKGCCPPVELYLLSFDQVG